MNEEKKKKKKNGLCFFFVFGNPFLPYMKLRGVYENDLCDFFFFFFYPKRNSICFSIVFVYTGVRLRLE